MLTLAYKAHWGLVPLPLSPYLLTLSLSHPSSSPASTVLHASPVLAFSHDPRPLCNLSPSSNRYSQHPFSCCMHLYAQEACIRHRSHSPFTLLYLSSKSLPLYGLFYNWLVIGLLSIFANWSPSISWGKDLVNTC